MQFHAQTSTTVSGMNTALQLNAIFIRESVFDECPSDKIFGTKRSMGESHFHFFPVRGPSGLARLFLVSTLFNPTEWNDSMREPFQTTNWRLVDAAGDSQHLDHRAARDELVLRYWKPVYSFLLALHFSNEDAEDLAQEFLTRLCDRNWIRRASPERGRFRTYLLTLLKRFLSDQVGIRSRKQTQFERSSLPGQRRISEDQLNLLSHSLTAEEVFLKRWSSSLIERVCEEVRVDYQTQGRASWFDVFSACLIAEEAEGLSQREAARSIQLRYRGSKKTSQQP